MIKQMKLKNNKISQIIKIPKISCTVNYNFNLINNKYYLYFIFFVLTGSLED